MSVSLRQAHGFEGFFSRSEPGHSHDKSIPQGPNAYDALLEARPAAPASTDEPRGYNDLLVGIDDLISNDGVVRHVPEELLERPEKTRVAMVNLRIRQVRKIVPFQVGCKARKKGFRTIAG